MRLAKFIYHKNLDAKIWDKSGNMNMLVQNALMMVAWGYIAYLQENGFAISDADIKDIFVHGSTTNYYYDDTSDIDICIVADMTRMMEKFPNTNLAVMLKAMLGSWKRNYFIKIAGRNVDISFADVDRPYYAPGYYKVGPAYSLVQEGWIRKPVRLDSKSLRVIKGRAKKKYRGYARMYKIIKARKMGDLYIETFLNKINMDRERSLGIDFAQPITVETMAFRMLRHRGMTRGLRLRVRRLRSRNFNV